MTHNLPPELFVYPSQRADLHQETHPTDNLRQLYERVVRLAIQHCQLPATDNDLPPDRKMTQRHTMSTWGLLGSDDVTASTVQGRLHLSQGNVARQPHSWVLAESRLVRPADGRQSRPLTIASFAGYDDPKGNTVSITLGQRDRINLRTESFLLPAAEYLVERFEAALANPATDNT